jgi:Got1/Sft2-like family
VRRLLSNQNGNKARTNLKQRFYGFGICFAAGFMISFFSTFLLFSGKVSAFAILYSLGNIISLIATGFLVGFVAQLTKMFDKSRVVAALVFIATLILTLISAFAFNSGILTLILCIVQVCFGLILVHCSAMVFVIVCSFCKRCSKRAAGGQIMIRKFNINHDCIL